MGLLKILRALANTHIPTILVIAGIIFLFLALGGQFGAKVVTERIKTKFAGILGIVLLLCGVALFLSQAGPPEEKHGGEEKEVIREPGPPEEKRGGEEKEVTREVQGLEREEVIRRIQELEGEIEHNDFQQKKTREEIDRLSRFLETDPDARKAIQEQERRLEALRREKEELEQTIKSLREQLKGFRGG